MREDADFTGYLAARWPSLVRTLVLLGCPAELAPAVAREAMARCRAGWARTRSSEDVDVVVHRALLEAWGDRRRTPWWQGLGPPDDGLRPDLVGALDRLTPDARAELVLQRHAGLGGAQAATVIGRVSGNGLPASPGVEELRVAAEGLVVLAPPTLAELDSPPGRRPPRRTLRALASAAPLALVVAGLTWWATREPDESELPAVAAVSERNPAEAAWFANGVLHLDHVALELPPLRDFAVLGTGAVYGDTEGRVVAVADDGQREQIGTKDPDVPLVASDEQGWVAWVDRRGDVPRLLVHEVASRSLVGELALFVVDPADARPIAVDDETVFYSDGSGAHGWRPPDGAPALDDVDPFGLLDVASRTRAYQLDPSTIHVAQGFFSVSFDLRGSGAQLSEDGEFVLTRDPATPSLGTLLVYDTESGDQLPTGLAEDDVALAAALGPDGTATYVVARAEDRPLAGEFLRSSFSGQLELRTCELETGVCETLRRFSSAGSRPLVAY